PEPVPLERLARFERAVAAAADEHDGALGVVGPGKLLHLADEVRVDLPVGTIVPGDMQRADRMADEEVLHLAAAVDEQRIRRGPQELERLPCLQMLHGGAIIEPASTAPGACATVAGTHETPEAERIDTPRERNRGPRPGGLAPVCLTHAPPWLCA